MTNTHHITSVAELDPIISELIAKQKEHGNSTVVIALSGELGAGKTTFTQQLAKQLGVTEPVTSPTFTLMKQYTTTDSTYGSLVHIDAYRIESAAELVPLHLESVFTAPNTIVSVEWPEHIASIMPRNAIAVTMASADQTTRSVIIQLPKE